MKQLFTTLFVMMLSMTAMGQGATDKVTCILKDGTKTDYSLSEYNRITYTNNKQYIHKKNGSSSTDGVSIDDIESLEFDIYHVPYEEESAASAVKNMRLGWNLGNTLDCWGTALGNNQAPEKYEKAWGQPVTQKALITFMKNEGFNAIRVPVTWWQHLDSEDNIDEPWMARVEEVVNYVLDNGMYCILNVHHDTGHDDALWLKADNTKFDQLNVRFVKIWQQIANRFIDYNQRLLFEGYNEMLDKNGSWTEPQQNSSYTAVNKFAQSFVNTIRATGGNNRTRNLIVNTYSAAHSQKTLDNFTVPTDEVSGHLIAEIHSYDPYNWMKTTNATWGTAQSNELKNMYSRLNAKFVSQGIPVIIGECGVLGDNDIDLNKNSTAKQKKAAGDHIADLIKQGKALDIPTFYWMTIIDGADRSVPQWTIPEVVKAMKNACNEEP